MSRRPKTQVGPSLWGKPSDSEHVRLAGWKKLAGVRSGSSSRGLCDFNDVTVKQLLLVFTNLKLLICYIFLHSIRKTQNEKGG